MILLITHCHKNFGGWFRAKNIAQSLENLGVRAKFISSPRHENALYRFRTGFLNCLTVLRNRSQVVHIFELVMPETLFPALLCKLLRRKVIIDVADEWLDSPTYHQGNPLLRLYIRLVHTKLIKLFPYITVPCEYLAEKMRSYTKSKVYKLINGVDTSEFEPVSRTEARKRLGISPNLNVLIAIGNTFGNQRKELLNKTFAEIQKTNPKTILISGRHLSDELLPLYLGAADLALFPTDGSNAELACISIRVMTYLNAGLVIGTDNSPSEWHKTLKPYDCLVQGSTPYVLARKVNEFLSDKSLRKRKESGAKLAKLELDWYIVGKKLYYEFYKRICR